MGWIGQLSPWNGTDGRQRLTARLVLGSIITQVVLRIEPVETQTTWPGFRDLKGHLRCESATAALGRVGCRQSVAEPYLLSSRWSLRLRPTRPSTSM